MHRPLFFILVAFVFAVTTLSARAQTSIEIDLEEQLAYLIRNGEVLHATRISTGRSGYETTRGTFKIVQKERRHYSNMYGSIVDRRGRTIVADADSSTPVPRGARFVPASMPYFMRFNGAEGMHAGVLPGGPASHGCVRLPRESAAIFFDNAPVGTPVTVFGRTANYRRYRQDNYARSPRRERPMARRAEPPLDRGPVWR